MKLCWHNTSTLFLSGLFGTAWTIFLFVENLQMRTAGLQRLALMAAAFTILFFLTGWLIRRLEPMFREFQTQQKNALFLFSFIFAGLLIVMTPIRLDKFFYALLPTHELTISVEDNQIEQVEVMQFNTASGAINPAGIIQTAEGTLSWKGKVGDQAVLALRPLERQIFIRVDWDGLSQSVDLSASTKRDILFVQQYFDIPWVQRLLWLVSAWLALSSGVFVGTLLLVSAPWRSIQSKVHWLWYASPMILVWMLYLLTFWPGLMSPDSIMQWGEVQSGHLSDAHPAFHTMLIWLLSRAWNTPAVLIIFHILLLSLLTAWGLGELQKQKVSPIIIWAGSALFALLPINGLLVISVWKDITYACALFAFFLQFVKISLSNGKWLENNWNLAGLIFAGLTAGLVRHNGLPVVLGSLAVLMFAYRNALRRILISIFIFLFLWVGIRGPLYASLNVKLYPGFGNILFLDHINAHIHAGTDLRPAEKTFIESLLPLSAWPYNCADSDIRKMDGPIPFDYFSQATEKPAQIAINLFLRDPMVDIEHTLCASSLVWKVNTGQYLSVVSLSQNKDGDFKWVSENNLGLVEQSFFPGLIPWLPSMFSDKSLLVKPAFYLLATILLLTTVSLRLPRAKLLLLLVPLFFQTGVMLLVNFAQDFRYFFSTVLIALFSLIMLFIPRD